MQNLKKKARLAIIFDHKLKNLYLNKEIENVKNLSTLPQIEE